MKIEEYLKSLPESIVSGEEVQLPEKSFRDIFNFLKLEKNDIFYHLGCGDGTGIAIALKEYQVRKAVGIDNNPDKIKLAKNILDKNKMQGKLICDDIQNVNISDATAILFWFTNEDIINNMMNKFKDLKEGTRIITIWGPLPDCLPEKVKFPYIINLVPFKKANSLQEQVLAVFGVKCIDFVTAWEFAERYTKAISIPEIENDRFLTIIQTLVIWINAKNLGVSCGEKIPESIKTYIDIMKTHFNIDFEHLLK
ncbi:class I SAM-dependent methyltransferase [Nitrosarchaeum sp.]|uniref:class I SAM-dependent methyltransferase n=1 Tax=Nitrosarchaeum sp. TaxID=2026886 RepID=UPI00247B85D4|nr:class I SAM-dependent methyltransferase [Nitrosarchaeum sp.]MCV0412063.1 class I SAM-dependent methyltransferase [Nitrosarchaeum sp.]